MSAAAGAAIVIATQAANAARKAKCEAFVKDFDHNSATVPQRQEYAACIGRLHPDPLTADQTLLLKGAIVIVLVAMVAGLVAALRDRSWGWDGLLLVPILWGICAGVVLFVGMLVVIGVQFVLVH